MHLQMVIISFELEDKFKFKNNLNAEIVCAKTEYQIEDKRVAYFYKLMYHTFK